MSVTAKAFVMILLLLSCGKIKIRGFYPFTANSVDLGEQPLEKRDVSKTLNGLKTLAVTLPIGTISKWERFMYQL